MKNVFNKWLGNNSNNNVDLNNQPEVASIVAEPTIPYNLFVDNKQPEIAAEEKVNKISELSTFLNRNYYSIGFSDGYEFHSSDILKLNIDATLSDYRLLLDKEIRQVKSKTKEMHVELAHLGELAPAQRQAMNVHINELKEFVIEYTDQKALSVDSEGWISAAINNYKRGFESGVSRYLREKGMLNTIGIL